MTHFEVLQVLNLLLKFHLNLSLFDEYCIEQKCSPLFFHPSPLR